MFFKKTAFLAEVLTTSILIRARSVVIGHARYVRRRSNPRESAALRNSQCLTHIVNYLLYS
jgi:hypothetical protein